ncbi:hypothetical protein BX600DRAFT_494844 [Xylariales sp. PMI_506]|nr:hypothetical protein BX600DRAFT_494844 [Xylariales sp. PMI_506]
MTEYDDGIAYGDNLGDTVEDLTIGAEVTFLVPLSAKTCEDIVGAAHDVAPPPTPTIDVDDDNNDEDGGERGNCKSTAEEFYGPRLLQHVFGAIAAVIASVPGQRAVTAFEPLPPSDVCETGSYWTVKKARSAMPPLVNDNNNNGVGKLVWVPVEISSPVLRWRDPASIVVIRRVLEALQREDRTVSIGSGSDGGSSSHQQQKHPLIAVANESTEVHVHVGRADGEPFALATLKKLAALAWLAEPTLRLVKNPESPNFYDAYTEARPVRGRSRLSDIVYRGDQFYHCYFHESSDDDGEQYWSAMTTPVLEDENVGATRNKTVQGNAEAGEPKREEEKNTKDETGEKAVEENNEGQEFEGDWDGEEDQFEGLSHKLLDFIFNFETEDIATVVKVAVEDDNSHNRAADAETGLKPPNVTAASRSLTALAYIARAQSATELGQLLCGATPADRRLGFDFSRFGCEDEQARRRAAPRTVRCRVLGETVDPGVVVGWVQIWGALAELALDDGPGGAAVCGGSGGGGGTAVAITNTSGAAARRETTPEEEEGRAMEDAEDDEVCGWREGGRFTRVAMDLVARDRGWDDYWTGPVNPLASVQDFTWLMEQLQLRKDVYGPVLEIVKESFEAYKGKLASFSEGRNFA